MNNRLLLLKAILHDYTGQLIHFHPLTNKLGLLNRTKKISIIFLLVSPRPSTMTRQTPIITPIVIVISNRVVNVRTLLVFSRLCLNSFVSIDFALWFLGQSEALGPNTPKLLYYKKKSCIE
jgi:hypothetical protein